MRSRPHPIATGWFLLATILMLLGPSERALAAPRDAGRQITVNGEAEVRVVPDQVVITLGVETNHKSLAAAREQNEGVVKALLRVTDAAGVARRDVQTDHVSIAPRYESQHYDQRLLIGYTVRRAVVVTLRDISKFDSLLGSALEAGINEVHGVQFRTSELRRYRDQARALAIQAAKEKASAMAGGLGMHLGPPSSITETYCGWWSSYAHWWGHSRFSQMTQNTIQQAPQDEGNGAQGDALAPGSLAVSARVTVVFDLVEGR